MLGKVFPAPPLALIRLEAQKLLLIVPFVKRARLVESFVTLQPDKLGAEHLGQHLCHLGLARASRALDEQWLVEREREKDRGLDALVGDVAGFSQPVADEFGRDIHFVCATQRIPGWPLSWVVDRTRSIALARALSANFETADLGLANSRDQRSPGRCKHGASGPMIEAGR